MVTVTAALCLSASACSSAADPPAAAPLPPVAVPSAIPSTPPPTSAPPVLTRAPTAAPAGLQADFAQLKQSVGGRTGLVIAPVGRSGTPIVLGDWTTGAAWSTSKVPLAIAALRNSSGGASLAASVNLAITQSDNAAADVLWRSLGDGATAARKVDAVLREGHDSATTTQSQVVRPGFSAFGQTIWSLQNQAQFTAALPCLRDSASVLAMMANVAGEQQWGLGTIPGARFKGGWGPGASGDYLVRQLGIIDVPGGQVAITVATEPSSGSFDAGTQVLSRVARVIQQHAAELAGGNC